MLQTFMPFRTLETLQPLHVIQPIEPVQPVEPVESVESFEMVEVLTERGGIPPSRRLGADIRTKILKESLRYPPIRGFP